MSDNIMKEDIKNSDNNSTYNESTMKEEEEEELELEPVGNPAPPLDVDLNLLRGDRIGDTVYSGKWCIQTVMKLMQSDVTMKAGDKEEEEVEQGEEDEGDESGSNRGELVDMEEELQNEVGVLWDMTSNLDVCQYLQSIGAIDSICHVITTSRCPRATEMCIGMLGNIITHDELWQTLQEDKTLFGLMVPLLSSTDQPVLLELCRFFTTALSHSEITNCYEAMCQNGSSVTQDLLRILSGSTNCDLLSHVLELTHILMSLDKEDCHFNALFAHPDFITAVLESSKEIGFEHENSGQSRVMEILHSLTTYQAGIDAMEMCMGAMTQSIIKYLRCLSHNINLSSSCEVVTTIITLLNHIFCRSLDVRIDLISSSKLLQHILKILVALYRRLGLYDAIASIPKEKRHGKSQDSNHRSHHSHSHHHHKKHHHHHHRTEEVSTKADSKVSLSSWDSTATEEDCEQKSSQGGSTHKSSWSERAGATSTTNATPTKHQTIATPEPSPKHSQGVKEIEFLSWSERRVASPLVAGEDETVSVWKVPIGKKKTKKTPNKLTSSPTKTDPKTSSCEVEGVRGLHMDEEGYEEENTVLLSSSGDKEGCYDNGETKTATMGETGASEGDEMSKQSQRVCHRSLSNVSGGFSPPVNENRKYNDNDTGIIHNMETEETNKLSTDEKEESNIKGTEIYATATSAECENGDEEDTSSKQGAEAEKKSLNDNNEVKSDPLSNGDDDSDSKNIDKQYRHDQRDNFTVLQSDESNGVLGKHQLDHKGDGDHSKEREMDGRDGNPGTVAGRVRRTSYSTLDKYNALFDALREFLSDYFNNFREGLLTDKGVAVVSEAMSFLDSQCRPSTISILCHCIGGPSHDLSTPFGRILHLAALLNTPQLQSLLTDIASSTSSSSSK